MPAGNVTYVNRLMIVDKLDLLCDKAAQELYENSICNLVKPLANNSGLTLWCLDNTGLLKRSSRSNRYRNIGVLFDHCSAHDPYAVKTMPLLQNEPRTVYKCHGDIRISLFWGDAFPVLHMHLLIIPIRHCDKAKVDQQHPFYYF